MSERIRRALLFIPGDDRYKIEKGGKTEVDSIILDIEDGVAFTQKAAARQTIQSALLEVDFGTSERLVRINPAVGSDWQQDIDVTIEGQPDGYVIPKVENQEQILTVAQYLTQAENHHQWQANSIRLFAIIETARGVINLGEIASASERLTALIFGAEDLAGDIGAMRTPDGWEVFYARSAVVIHAKANGLQAIDTPYVGLTSDDSNLVAATEQAHYMGYTGKLAIHPKQITTIQDVFTPSEEQIQHAKALITAHDEHQEAGKGAFRYEGRMVDMPMIRSAELTLARARAAGKDIDQW